MSERDSTLVKVIRNFSRKPGINQLQINRESLSELYESFFMMCDDFATHPLEGMETAENHQRYVLALMVYQLATIQMQLRTALNGEMRDVQNELKDLILISDEVLKNFAMNAKINFYFFRVLFGDKSLYVSSDIFGNGTVEESRVCKDHKSALNFLSDKMNLDKASLVEWAALPPVFDHTFRELHNKKVVAKFLFDRIPAADLVNIIFNLYYGEVQEENQRVLESGESRIAVVDVKEPEESAVKFKIHKPLFSEGSSLHSRITVIDDLLLREKTPLQIALFHIFRFNKLAEEKVEENQNFKPIGVALQAIRNAILKYSDRNELIDIINKIYNDVSKSHQYNPKEVAILEKRMQAANLQLEKQPVDAVEKSLSSDPVNLVSEAITALTGQLTELKETRDEFLESESITFPNSEFLSDYALYEYVHGVINDYLNLRATIAELILMGQRLENLIEPVKDREDLQLLRQVLTNINAFKKALEEEKMTPDELVNEVRISMQSNVTRERVGAINESPGVSLSNTTPTENSASGTATNSANTDRDRAREARAKKFGFKIEVSEPEPVRMFTPRHQENETPDSSQNKSQPKGVNPTSKK